MAGALYIIPSVFIANESRERAVVTVIPSRTDNTHIDRHFISSVNHISSDIFYCVGAFNFETSLSFIGKFVFEAAIMLVHVAVINGVVFATLVNFCEPVRSSSETPKQRNTPLVTSTGFPTTRAVTSGYLRQSGVTLKKSAGTGEESGGTAKTSGGAAQHSIGTTQRPRETTEESSGAVTSGHQTHPLGETKAGETKTKTDGRFPLFSLRKLIIGKNLLE